MSKKPEKYWLVLVKYYLKLPALVRCYIKPIQTNRNNQYWNDNKPVLKIPLVLALSNNQKYKIKKL